jgi:Bacterial regulatory helix-turn-helix protein, lysR family
VHASPPLSTGRASAAQASNGSFPGPVPATPVGDACRFPRPLKTPSGGAGPDRVTMRRVLDVRRLLVLRAVAQHGSIAATRAIGYSQAAVSHHIHRLEANPAAGHPRRPRRHAHRRRTGAGGPRQCHPCRTGRRRDATGRVRPHRRRPRPARRTAQQERHPGTRRARRRTSGGAADRVLPRVTASGPSRRPVVPALSTGQRNTS